MKKLNLLACIPFIIFIVLIFVAMSGEATEGPDPLQARALQLITETADRICVSVETEGQESLIEYSGEARAELSKVIKSLVDIGIEGAAKYQESKYQGLLREDLVEAIKAEQHCKLAVFQRLEEKLIVHRTGKESETDEQEKRRHAVLDPYNYEWKCEIAIKKESGQQIAAGDLFFGKMTSEPKMSFARLSFSSIRTRKLPREITFDHAAWSAGFFGECPEGECMSFADNTEPKQSVILVNKVVFNEDEGRIYINGVVFLPGEPKHSYELGRLSGICQPK